MINPNYTSKKENNIISVKNFLNAELAEKIESDMKKIAKEWWYISMYPANSNMLKQETKYYDGLYNNPQFIDEKEYNKTWFNQGNFGYMFKRTIDNHYETCYCEMCNLKKYFDSSEVKDELSKIVGEKVTHFNTTFCSKYENDDYLSIHHDKGNGDYAFVFQLTKDWNPSYGGLLHFYDETTKEVYKSVNPIFNSLTIFKIKNVR
jgi:Rps23 Pro-64 3,4-dihydroxylase Tpa1-like proline 4-hydroxylase